MQNLTGDNLEKSSSDESNNEADNDSNDETQSDGDKDNDESNEWFVKCWKKYFNNNKSLIVYANHVLLGLLLGIIRYYEV